MKDEFLEHLLAIIKSKKDENPEKSYTAMLQQSDVNETLKKIEEEAFEEKSKPKRKPKKKKKKWKELNNEVDVKRNKKTGKLWNHPDRI